VVLTVVHRLLGLSDLGIVLSLSVSGFQTAIAHSSASHWLLPDSLRHYKHHAQHRVNYGENGDTISLSL
jgi:sterol desaturase/sphingolipid hydroxylase (fatty acid hydroxylase superfamily)